MKIAINRCWGGFRLSHTAIILYAKLKGIKLYAVTENRTPDGRLDMKHFIPYKGRGNVLRHYLTKPLKEDGTYEGDSYYYPDIDRSDPLLIQVIEKLGKKASSDLSNIVIKEIPDDVKWEINNYDGMESIHEVHRSW